MDEQTGVKETESASGPMAAERGETARQQIRKATASSILSASHRRGMHEGRE